MSGYMALRGTVRLGRPYVLPLLPPQSCACKSSCGSSSGNTFFLWGRKVCKHSQVLRARTLAVCSNASQAETCKGISAGLTSLKSNLSRALHDWKEVSDMSPRALKRSCVLCWRVRVRLYNR